jgi:hypothetical protein
MIISEGLSNAEMGQTFANASSSSKKVRMETYISELQWIIKAKILGDEYNGMPHRRWWQKHWKYNFGQ